MIADWDEERTSAIAGWFKWLISKSYGHAYRPTLVRNFARSGVAGSHTRSRLVMLFPTERIIAFQSPTLSRRLSSYPCKTQRLSNTYEAPPTSMPFSWMIGFGTATGKLRVRVTVDSLTPSSVRAVEVYLTVWPCTRSRRVCPQLRWIAN
jgi:hypothetical protein